MYITRLASKETFSPSNKIRCTTERGHRLRANWNYFGSEQWH